MPAVNPGTTGLVAWWSLDEASGQRNDSHGTNHLTDNNTVLSAVGKVGNAADFEASNSEYLSIADNAALSTGDVDFTLGGWVKAESLTPSIIYGIMGKDNQTEREYALLAIENGATNFQALMVAFGAGNANIGQVFASSFGNLSTAAWYFVVSYHSATDNQVGISVNGGAYDTAATSGPPTDKGAPFTVGRYYSNRYFDGLIDEAFLYKRVLTADEITWLYNAGAGRAYADLSGGAAGLPVIAWEHARIFGG